MEFLRTIEKKNYLEPMPKKWIKISYTQFIFVAGGKYFVVIFYHFPKLICFSDYKNIEK